MNLEAGAFDPDAVKGALRTAWIGRDLRAYRSTTSTNDLLLRGGGGAPGTVAVAEEQTEGRGRRGREWTAPPYRALLFSVLLRPGGDAESASLANLAAGVAVVRGVEERGGPPLRVRWPNDLYSGERKVCGILSEYRPAEGNLVIGVGLNVNQTAEELPPGGASLRTITGRTWVREPLLASILGRLERAVDRLAAEGFEPLRREAEELSDLVGRPVTLDLGRETVRGRAVGIGPKGGLLLQEEKGLIEYRIGEVTRVLSVEGY
ncbi:MAG: biotin--[acetyl-CoA-carboxylase] ligase [Candidatus Eisenbacteria bacterium]